MSAQAGIDEQPTSAVTAVPIQLGRDSYGVAMVDAKSESIWIYEVNTRGPAQPVKTFGGEELALR